MSSPFKIISVLFTVAVLAHKSDKKVHDCVHDELDHIIRQQYVKYPHHPEPRDIFDVEPHLNRRRLAEDSDYELIRIVPYYDESITSSTLLTTDQQTYIKSLISASIRYFEQFVRVVPVDGPLFIDPCGWKRSNSEFMYELCTIDTIDRYCGSHAIIPADHMPAIWTFDQATTDSTLYQESGSGVADADLVVYVTYNESELCSTTYTIAYAGACASDMFGRPIAGSINFCARMLSEQYWKIDVSATLHELTHILVMSSALFGKFYNVDSGVFYDTDEVVSNTSNFGNDNLWIITDKVKEVAQNHFGCDSLIGAPLENHGGAQKANSHWEGKYFNTEYMIGSQFNGLDVVSEFTLALMQDSGWYKVDYNYAEPFIWGRNEGCSFFSDECIADYTSNYPQFWCDDAKVGCSAEYASVGSCSLYSTSVPLEHRYYSDNNVGGLEMLDYCGFILSDSSSTDDFEYICWDERGNVLDTRGNNHVYGVDSRCVTTIDDDGSTTSGYCYKHECVGFDSSTNQWSSVDIYVNTDVINCAQTDAFTTKSIASVTGIESIICPNIDAICGETSKPFECLWGEYNDEESECICSVGYTGSTCNTTDSVLVDEAQAGEYTIDTTSHESVCVTGITTKNGKFLNGGYGIQGTNDGIESFYNASSNVGTGIYVYFKRMGSYWLFSGTKGNPSYFGYCMQYADGNNDPNIEECDDWYIYNQEDFVAQTDVKVKYDMDVCDDAHCFWSHIWKQCVFVTLIVILF